MKKINFRKTLFAAVLLFQLNAIAAFGQTVVKGLSLIHICPVPIPDIGYHIVFLAFKLSRLVKPKLIVRRTPCCLVTPFHIITFHLYHQITVWCSATIHVSCPPCAAGRSDIMFVNGRGGQLIFIKVRVSGENMYLVRPQQLEKRIGVARISPRSYRVISYWSCLLYTSEIFTEEIKL